jgi:hypothetical protein
MRMKRMRGARWIGCVALLVGFGLLGSVGTVAAQTYSLQVTGDADEDPTGTDAMVNITRSPANNSGSDIVVTFVATGSNATDLNLTVLAALSGRIPDGDMSFSSPLTVEAAPDDVYGEGTERVTINAIISGRTVASTTVSVIDDDTADAADLVTVMVDTDSLTEGADSDESTITVALPANVSFANDLTVSLSLGGTAEPEDYRLDKMSLTLEALTVAAEDEAVLMVVDDSVYEPRDETVVITVTVDGDEVREEQTITLMDNDPAPEDFTLTADAMSVPEGGKATLTVSLRAAADGDQTIMLNFGGTATKGTDYVVGSETLVLEDGDMSVMTDITTVEEAMPEPDETIEVTATVGGEEIGMVTVTIMNDDGDPLMPPAAPTGVQVMGGDKMLTVSWMGAEGATSYYVRKREVQGSLMGSWVPDDNGKMFSGSPAVFGPPDVELMNGVTYEVQVRAANDAGMSDWSAGEQGTTIGPDLPPPPLDTPMPTTGGTVTHDSVTISWAAVEGATGYSVNYGVEGTGVVWR